MADDLDFAERLRTADGQAQLAASLIRCALRVHEHASATQDPSLVLDEITTDLLREAAVTLGRIEPHIEELRK
jgi:hypothetical protein